MPQVQLGRPVPDFALPASNGNIVALSDFRGKKVVLFFYPHDMTPTCTQEACDFRDSYGKFRELNAEVVGVSPDSVESHRKFIEKRQLPFLLLADEQLIVCKMFDVWRLKKLYGREYMGVQRSTFLIDEEGVLVKEWRNVKVKNHVDDVWKAAKL